MTYENNNTTQPPGYGHCTGQPTLDGTSSQELEDFVGAKFYCLHALADGSQHIQIREKTLEFSTVNSITLHKENNPVLNWRYWLTQIDLYSGHKTVVVVVLSCHPSRNNFKFILNR